MKKLLIFITLLLAIITCIASCGEKDNSDPKPEHTHEFGEWSVTKNPTCETEGQKNRYCSCGEKQSDVIPTVPHADQILPAKEATCTETGLTEGKKCSSCGEILVEQETIPALGHSRRTYTEKDSSCNVYNVTVCDRDVCDFKESVATGTVNHSFGEWEHINTSTDSPCGANQIYERVCADCGTTEQRVEPATGHDYKATVISIHGFDPTTGEATTGEIKYTCQNEGCDSTYYEYEGHNYTDTVTPPTCTEQGYTLRSCACGYYEKFVTDEPRHVPGSPVKENNVDPTCIADGSYDSVVYCTACSEEIGRDTVTVEALGHSYNNGYCTVCGAKDPDYVFPAVPDGTYVRCDKDGTPNESGSYILFGEYPQTIKADNVTVTSTTDSRGYYLGSDGFYYAKVTATPQGSNYTFSTGATVTSGEVYYFKVEPIRWRILSTYGETALILCDSIIANMGYQPDYYQSGDYYYTTANGAPSGTYANNYKYSEVRRWLNDNFYNTAFSELQRELILTTELDNSAKSTNPHGKETFWNNGVNEYACENTSDKIFLLSLEEATDSAYGFAVYDEYDTARRMLTSDYSRATGIWMRTSASNYGNGFWWLRSPNYNHSGYARGIFDYGSAYSSDVYDRRHGVVPALRIRLSEATNPSEPDEKEYIRCDKDGTPNESGSYILFGEYPQTIKADNVTVTSTTDSRGYYLGSDGFYYAKVTASPYGSDYTFSTGATVTSGEVYYFKVEPIRWRILSTDGETALILCDSIIANMGYQPDYYQSGDDYYTTANGAPSGTYANDYKYSEVRRWLNDNFYNTAFSELQRELILTTAVDNSAKTLYNFGYTGTVNSKYACENTNDRIFLLSQSDVTSSAYGFAAYDEPDTVRKMLTSDYSRATGAYMSTSSGCYGNGFWWLRSPSCYSSNLAREIYFDGNAYSHSNVNIGYNGVLPALRIKL